jgi:hypothetical protein
MMIVRFWEARVADGRLVDAVAWARSHVLMAALAAGAHGGEVVHADADQATQNPARIVVLMRWADEPRFIEPVADPSLIERSHAWNFYAS